MGSLRKDTRGRGWQARYRDPAGKQRTRTFPTKADARAFLSSFDVDVRNGTWVAPELGRTPFDEWVELWQSTITHLRPPTRARDETYLRCYVLPAFTGRSLASTRTAATAGGAARISSAAAKRSRVAKRGWGSQTMTSQPTPQPIRQRPPDKLDLQTQFEAILHEIWTREAEWRAEDRIDLAVRLNRDE